MTPCSSSTRSSPDSSSGLLTGGSAARLGDLRVRWAPLIALGMAGQVLLFSSPLGDALGPAAPVVYVASNVAVLVAVWRNLAIPGLPLVLIGGAANLVAIVANRGFMPVSPEALVAIGRAPHDGYSNSRLVDEVVLGPLTDLFAMPSWVPMANIFSIGDVLIGVGAAMAVVAAMHGRGPLEPRTAPDGATQRCARALTRCAGATGTTGGWPLRPPADHRDARSDVRSVMTNRPGQTRRESGTQSQGSPLGKTARLPEAVARSPRSMRCCREGEPGALHCGSVPSGDDRALARRRPEVELIQQV